MQDAYDHNDMAYLQCGSAWCLFNVPEGSGRGSLGLNPEPDPQTLIPASPVALTLDSGIVRKRQQLQQYLDCHRAVVV